jgi:hypothetical protein
MKNVDKKLKKIIDQNEELLLNKSTKKTTSTIKKEKSTN